MDGGTFTISNGGVFGSMFGTPIINPPQSAILGMHGIFDRPVARNGQVSFLLCFFLSVWFFLLESSIGMILNKKNVLFWAKNID